MTLLKTLPHAGLLVALLLLAACAPSQNWREVRPEGSGAELMFPCKPDQAHRPASAQEPAMGLAVCRAGGLSFSLSWSEMPRPDMLGPALLAMGEGLRQRLKAPEAVWQAVQVPGMTPRPESGQQALAGPGQQARQALFSRGLKVYQLVMLGPRDDEPAWQNFVASVRLPE
ncbi:hypothetical protein H5407_15635 [Mitsuaria sp. WAJ17]|uniref:hypothetical protein n=1 Tax=Mitsuaria sp. WAJ17 TaxID=2761452 RepID=UPI0016001220|nr:hypothetical protein [Mitsuaria sp. WAJ17]MBB2486657.1 hypothetical protein [Mitsuaria sp. WAJ17]